MYLSLNNSNNKNSISIDGTTRHLWVKIWFIVVHNIEV